ncbi:MAG: BatA domain-containing protein [Planctomycetota bacterium]|jgi:hypothetical protein
MNFLFPLFLAGIAAVAVPIVLHLVRRHTRDRVTFSSLMFLRTTRPRFTSRSRLENLPLLILRCIMLCLLALAFSRPFFSRPAADKQVRPAKRIVLLIDTSASMRRAGMWGQAIDEARSALADASATDRVCVMSFDKSTRTLIGFEQWQMLEPARRVPVAIEEISKLSPGWNGTVLGQALVNAAEAIEDDEANEQQRAASLRQVVLVSDLQQGSRLAALRSYEWPERTELAVKPIVAKGTTNAALQLLTDRDDLAVADGQYRAPVRITNSPDATKEQFTLRWAGRTGPDEADRITDVYVAPGHSAVVHVRPPDAEQAGRRLILTGDDHEFDNALYLAPQLKQQVNIVYMGDDDPNDPREMLYYVRRCFETSLALNPRIIFAPEDDDIAKASFVIIADVLEREQATAVEQYLESGGTALLAMKSPQAATDVGALTGVGNLQAEEAEVERYAMLDRIEFNHPLLAPFAEPQFGDFTRIHFWKHRTIDMARMPDARVLASFDSNEPAVFEQPVGAGSLLVLTSSWHPSDSQLALSSKFVPLLYSVLEYGGVLVGQRSQHFVGDSVPVSYSQASQPIDMKIRKPDDSLISHDAGRPKFAGADLPGIYRIESSAGERLFAVNLPVAESRTAPMSVEEFEGLGVSLGQSSNVPTELVRQASRRSSFVDRRRRVAAVSSISNSSRSSGDGRLWHCLRWR